MICVFRNYNRDMSIRTLYAVAIYDLTLYGTLEVLKCFVEKVKQLERSSPFAQIRLQ